MVEQILSDFDQAYDLNYVGFRYFNAAGADPTGLLGEDNTPETPLIPFSDILSQAWHWHQMHHGCGHSTNQAVIPIPYEVAHNE